MAAARRRAMSGGAMLMFVGIWALYQMTSLVLGPAAGDRRLQLSISVPAVDLRDLSEPVIVNVNLVLGTLARPAVSPAAVVMEPRHAAVKASVPAQTVTVVKAVVLPATPAPVVPTAEPSTHPLLPSGKPVPSAAPVIGSAGD